jgi:hypothetical protein
LRIAVFEKLKPFSLEQTSELFLSSNGLACEIITPEKINSRALPETVALFDCSKTAAVSMANAPLNRRANHRLEKPRVKMSKLLLHAGHFKQIHIN